MARIPSDMPLEDLDNILPQLVDRGLPDGGEFLAADLDSDERTAELITLLVWHGYLPMGGMGMLLAKIHRKRCVFNPKDIHIAKKVRKKAKGFHLTVNSAWELVVAHIQDLTWTSKKGDCWLTDQLANAYQAVGSRAEISKWHRGGVAFHSIELWHSASGDLVAGEIGYTCGSIYSSCTGFTQKDKYPGLGSVQLAALGRWLTKSGFELWDLGMELDYKLELGGKMVQRSEWARLQRSLRGRPAIKLCSPSSSEEGDAQRDSSHGALIRTTEVNDV